MTKNCTGGPRSCLLEPEIVGRRRYRQLFAGVDVSPNIQPTIRYPLPRAVCDYI